MNSWPPITTLVACAVLSFTPLAQAQTVKVHLDANPRVVLEEDANVRWVPVCRAPCDRVLDVRGVYRVSGTNVQRQRVVLDVDDGKNVTIHVEPGSRTVNDVGLVLLPIGIGALIGGTLVAFASWLQSDVDTARFGAALAGGGAVTALTGLMIYIASRTVLSFSL